MQAVGEGWSSTESNLNAAIIKKKQKTIMWIKKSLPQRTVFLSDRLKTSDVPRAQARELCASLCS